jgi:hypothetical protein
MNVTGFLQRLTARRDYRDQIVAVRSSEPRAASYRGPASHLSERLRTLLAQEGIQQLYSHQANAYDAIHSGESVLIASGTASGKILRCQLPGHPGQPSLVAVAIGFSQPPRRPRSVPRPQVARIPRGSRLRQGSRAALNADTHETGNRRAPRFDDSRMLRCPPNFG